MIVKEFETYLSRFARGPSEMDLRVRGLRAEGHLPTVRGRHAPHVTARQAAMMMLSAVSPRAVEAGAYASKIAALRVAPREGLDVPEGTSFGDYLSDLIASPEILANLPSFHIEILEDGRLVRIVFAGGRTIVFTSEQSVLRGLRGSPENYDKVGYFGFERRFYMSKGALQDVAIRIAEDDIGEMVEEA